MCSVSWYTDAHVWPLIWWHSLTLIEPSLENWVLSSNTKINGHWILTFVNNEWGISPWVSHVAFCSRTVGKGETVYSLLGVQEIDTGTWSLRLTGDSWKKNNIPFIRRQVYTLKKQVGCFNSGGVILHGCSQLKRQRLWEVYFVSITHYNCTRQQ